MGGLGDIFRGPGQRNIRGMVGDVLRECSKSLPQPRTARLRMSDRPDPEGGEGFVRGNARDLGVPQSPA